MCVCVCVGRQYYDSVHCHAIKYPLLLYKNTYYSYTGADIGAETKYDSASEIYVLSKCLFNVYYSGHDLTPTATPPCPPRHQKNDSNTIMEDMCISALSHTTQSVYPVCVGCVCMFICVVFVVCMFLCVVFDAYMCMCACVCVSRTLPHRLCRTAVDKSLYVYIVCVLIFLKRGCVRAPVDLCMWCVCACVYIYAFYVCEYILYNTYTYILCGQGKLYFFLLFRYTYGEQFTLYTHVEQKLPVREFCLYNSAHR